MLHGVRRILMAVGDFELEPKDNLLPTWVSLIEGAEIPFVVNRTPHSKTRMVGVLDGVGWTPTNDLVFFEHKSSSDTNIRNYMAKLRWDTQCFSYAWALYRIFGKMPAGVIYTVVRSKAPSPPQFKKNGRLYAKVPDTDPTTFERDLIEAGRSLEDLDESEMKVWEEVKQRPRVVREFFPINESDVNRWAEETNSKLLRVRSLRKDPSKAVRNRYACRSMWGRDCGYQDLCNESWNAREHYRERESHREVAEALEERTFLTSIEIQDAPRRSNDDGKRIHDFAGREVASVRTISDALDGATSKEKTEARTFPSVDGGDQRDSDEDRRGDLTEGANG
jgi:hypothetical protein